MNENTRQNDSVKRYDVPPLVFARGMSKEDQKVRLMVNMMFQMFGMMENYNALKDVTDKQA